MSERFKEVVLKTTNIYVFKGSNPFASSNFHIIKMFADQQKILIKKYLTLLIQEFIKDPQHQNINIVFKDYLGEKIAGYTKPCQ